MARPRRGEKAALVMLPTSRPSTASGDPDGGTSGAVDHQACQPPCNAAVPAVQNPDDDLLSDVAALCHADRAALDASFERNRLTRHVDAEARRARLYPQRLGGESPERLRAGAAQVARDRLACRRGTEEIDGLDAEILVADQHQALPVAVHLHELMRLDAARLRLRR